MMRLYLLGMPACGKSQLAATLGQSQGWSVWDNDAQIEAQTGRTIAALFAGAGESAFRLIERAVLLQTAALGGDWVVALGGGTPCFLDNMEWIKQQGKSLFLNVPLPVIARRLATAYERGQRPLLQQTTPETILTFLETLYEQRQSFYQQADYIMDGISTADTVQYIKNQVLK